jgi:FkbM family methyltransferase
MPMIKSMVANLAGRFGYEIRRKQPQQAESVLLRVNFATILDVGANTGQFSSAVLSSHPDATVHAFEPIPDCFAVLQGRFEGNSKFQAHNVAISDSNTVAEFEVNESSASSSLLPLDDTHKQMYPGARVVRTISVNTTTLDRWADNRILKRPLLLKLDVQGNELKVLRGAGGVLPGVDYLLTEINIGAMYKGQPSFQEIHDTLCSFGLEFIDFFPEKRDPNSLRCLFGDALFARRARQQDTREVEDLAERLA